LRQFAVIDISGPCPPIVGHDFENIYGHRIFYTRHNQQDIPFPFKIEYRYINFNVELTDPYSRLHMQRHAGIGKNYYGWTVRFSEWLAV